MTPVLLRAGSGTLGVFFPEDYLTIAGSHFLTHGQGRDPRGAWEDGTLFAGVRLFNVSRSGASAIAILAFDASIADADLVSWMRRLLDRHEPAGKLLLT
jgi:hypothetical protein